MTKYTKAPQPTGLQKRLINEVTSMMRANSKRLVDLSRETGLGRSYLSLLLHGHRAGTMATWDLLIRTGRSWGIVQPIRLMVDGYDDPVDLTDIEGDEFDARKEPPNGEVMVVESLREAGYEASTFPPAPQPVRVNKFRPE